MSDASMETQQGEVRPEEPQPAAAKPCEALTQQEQLPPLSDYEFRMYDRLAVRMNAFVSLRPGQQRWQVEN